jgi:hypothetical protein
VLYANADVSRALRERFVLHWESLRPVPRVTIDFGDGRRLERTLTGNSIHYVLDCRGRLVDALPGLYGPRAFLAAVTRAEDQAHVVASLSEEERAAALTGYHRERLAETTAAWAGDLAQLGVALPGERAADAAAAPRGDGQPPTAVEGARVAVTKSRVELPLLELAAGIDAATLEQATDDALWARIAALHAEDAVLDDGSRALVAQHNPTAAAAATRATTKLQVEDPLLRIVEQFQRSIAVDTVRNEYLLHRQIHQWIADGAATHDLFAFNERVYAELFLTPSSDPWLGLVPADTYTALEDDGRVLP